MIRSPHPAFRFGKLFVPVAGVLAPVILWSALLYGLRIHREAVFSEASHTLQADAVSAAGQIGTIIRTMETFIRLSRSWIEGEGIEILKSRHFAELLTGMRQEAGPGFGLFLVEHDGSAQPLTPFGKSRVNVKERGYFRDSLARPDEDSLALGPLETLIPEQSDRYLPLFLAMTRPHEAFAGLLAEIPAPLLLSQLESASPPWDGALSLVKTDGVTLATVPRNAQSPGPETASQEAALRSRMAYASPPTWVGPLAFHGAGKRLNALRIVPGVPLSIVTSADIDLILLPSLRETLVEVGALALLTLAFCFGAHLRATLRHAEEGVAGAVEIETNRRTLDLRQKCMILEDTLAALERTQDEIVAAEKMASLGRLVAGVAHEINTPLGASVTVATALSGRVDAFRAIVRTPPLRRVVLDQFVQSVAEAADLLTASLRAVNALVASFKEVAAAPTASQRRQFDLRECLDEVSMSLRPYLQHHGHSLKIDVPQGIILDSYPGSIAQLITNLCSNAVMHGFIDGLPGIVTVVADRSAEGRVRMRFSDNGQGIPVTDHKRVFDPFFTTRKGQGGTGLGLHIVYNIVTNILGGSITVQSVAEGGTLFAMDFPLQAPECTIPPRPDQPTAA